MEEKKLWSQDLLREIAREANVNIEVARPIARAFIKVLSDKLANGEVIAFKEIGTFRVKIGRDRKGKELYRLLELKPARRLMRANHLYDFWT